MAVRVQPSQLKGSGAESGVWNRDEACLRSAHRARAVCYKPCYSCTAQGEEDETIGYRGW